MTAEERAELADKAKNHPIDFTFKDAEAVINEYLGHVWKDTPFNHALTQYMNQVKALTDGLKELRDRFQYHCGKLDGSYDPPFVKEWDAIALNALNGKMLR